MKLTFQGKHTLLVKAKFARKTNIMNKEFHHSANLFSIEDNLISDLEKI